MKSLTLVSTLLVFSCTTQAGFYANTAHSRANCYGFNESITWNWSEYHWWEVHSFHDCEREGECANHLIKIPMMYTWRCAAFHTKEWEGPYADRWYVRGYHFYMDVNGRRIYDAYTSASNCAIYDGWWDYPNAKGE